MLVALVGAVSGEGSASTQMWQDCVHLGPLLSLQSHARVDSAMPVLDFAEMEVSQLVIQIEKS
eukprot:5165137-Amphidinium_carterae.1